MIWTQDNSGAINIDEFCEACMKLKGEAKSYDMHLILFQNNKETLLLCALCCVRLQHVSFQSEVSE